MSRSTAAAPGAAVLLLALAAGAAPTGALAGQAIYSYEPASDAARVLTDTGLSFLFETHLFGGQTIKRVIQTGDIGSADLARASDQDLGPGGLKAVLGGKAAAGELYQIEPEHEGAAFVNAVCPGAKQAWLVIGPLKRFETLTIQGVGKDAGARSARLCSTMVFSFRSDWRLPERTPPKVRGEFGGAP